MAPPIERRGAIGGVWTLVGRARPHKIAVRRPGAILGAFGAADVRGRGAEDDAGHAFAGSSGTGESENGLSQSMLPPADVAIPQEVLIPPGARTPGEEHAGETGMLPS